MKAACASGFSRSTVGTEITQNRPIQREAHEAREAKSPPRKMSAELGFFSVLLASTDSSDLGPYQDVATNLAYEETPPNLWKWLWKSKTKVLDRPPTAGPRLTRPMICSNRIGD